MLPLTELGHSRQGQQNVMEGGSETGKQPTCEGEGPWVYHFDAECSYLPRGTYTKFGGMALHPSKQPSRNNRAEGPCSIK